MKCYACGASGMRETVEKVDLDGVAQVEATVRRCTSCGEKAVAYERMDDLFRQVAVELSDADRRLMAHELAWLRKYTGASGRDWADFIGRSPETLSRWENGGEEYPLAFERLLRLAVKNGPMEWEYVKELRDPKKTEPRIELHQNSAGRWVRT
ncbi:MAG: hypothetical protein IT383_10575 [Deltaproteobacteria bacterium]|nr:hypothetical protein [Deltaproteobacteria bacterium]